MIGRCANDRARQQCGFTLSIIGCIITLVTGQFYPSNNAGSENIDNLIDKVFGHRNSSSAAPTDCVCVPINQCNKVNNSLITGEGLIDIRFEPCANSIEICCEEVRNPGQQPAPPTSPYNRTVTCGFRNENGVGFRITAGAHEAQFGEFPWMVAIMLRKEHAIRYHCGGSLIHPGVVMTAAHCVVAYVNKPEDVILRAGEWDSQSLAETLPYQERVSKRIIVHEKYLSGPAYNDIALIILEENFDFTENVDVICLPPADERIDNMKCVASGWGKNTFGETGVYQNILKRVDLPIVNRKTCEKELRTTRLGHKFVLHESFVCAGGVPGNDTCKGDGGGPLVCPLPDKPDHYEQVGIISWGIGCGNGIPAVYVSIPHFRSWIDEQFYNNNLDPSYYQDY